MKYGDFSSIVQLGVGLHLGTALLQLYGEIGLQPLVRILDRTRSLFSARERQRPPEECEDRLSQMEAEYDVFKIQLFQEYRRYVVLNSGVAVALILVLIGISFKAQDDVITGYEWITVIICAMSVLPAAGSLVALSIDANRLVKPMIQKVSDLESQCLAAISDPE